MPATMTARNYHVIVDAPAESVYDFVSDLASLPRWAVHFCKNIRLIENGAIVTSPSGDVYFGITGDRDQGILDWWCGPTMESAQRWPTRVVGLPDGRSLYNVTAIFSDTPPAGCDEMFADELGMLSRLVEEEQKVMA